MKTTFPIDAVIAWVDGDDPLHRAKRMAYMHGGAEARFEDVAGEVRYVQAGEIFFCVASILRFAPFIRRIFIVTDNQNPRLDDFVAKNFPDSTVEIRIVDHKVLFRGYEQHLPTFNSLSIASMLWRIPGLAQNYVYFNDDVMLVAPVQPEDFFTPEGWPVVYARKKCSWVYKLRKRWREFRKGRREIGFRDVMVNAADLIGKKYFISTGHMPMTVSRCNFEEFFAEHPEALEHNISFRFRDGSQFNSHVLTYMYAEQKGRLALRRPVGNSLYLGPDKMSEREIARKLTAAERTDKYLFACINSLDNSSKKKKDMIFGWLEQRLAVKL